MTVGRVEMCEFLSEDYAQRAENRGMDYKQAYKTYMKRAHLETSKIYLNTSHQ